MPRAKVNVAIVDDDESFARALERLLRASGFEVATYHSAEALLAATPLRPPECLVLDIQLSGMSGPELQQRLREAGDPASIIFVTAHDAPGVREEVERAHCSAYFLKPVAGAPLVEAIKKAVHLETNGPAN
jgi:FixJ family two-component response regulator